ncbi:hypothetical protein PMAC_001582 [Pneumocystis sp. 'macacae']|nr:hypothetical protein PMAC_001582 [Pneumocystis sp. 'macacae']
MDAAAAARAQLDEVARRLHGAGVLGERLLAQQQRLEDALAVPAQLSARLSELERELDDIRRDAGDTWQAAADAAQDSAWETGSVPGTPRWTAGTVSPVKQALSQRRRAARAAARTHNLELAAEIGQGLLGEVRRLQGVLGERDAQWRAVEDEKRGLEQQIECLEQRLRAVGESEERHREENWNLELRMQETEQRIGEAAAAEQRAVQENRRLQRQAAAQAETVDALREREAELSGEVEELRGRWETESAGFRRAAGEWAEERAELLRQLEELRAEAPQQVQRAAGVVAAAAAAVQGQETPEEWGEESPGSPVERTPARSAPLEAETARAALQHAQRTINGLRGAMQHEKGEKMRLRQELDEALAQLAQVERARGGGRRVARRRCRGSVYSRAAETETETETDGSAATGPREPLSKELEALGRVCVETADAGTMTDEVSDLAQIKSLLFGRDGRDAGADGCRQDVDGQETGEVGSGEERRGGAEGTRLFSLGSIGSIFRLRRKKSVYVPLAGRGTDKSAAGSGQGGEVLQGERQDGGERELAGGVHGSGPMGSDKQGRSSGAGRAGSGRQGEVPGGGTVGAAGEAEEQEGGVGGDGRGVAVGQAQSSVVSSRRTLSGRMGSLGAMEADGGRPGDDFLGVVEVFGKQHDGPVGVFSGQRRWAEGSEAAGRGGSGGGRGGGVLGVWGVAEEVQHGSLYAGEQEDAVAAGYGAGLGAGHEWVGCWEREEDVV